MPYVHRKNGKIVGLTKWPNGSTEQLPKDGPEVEAFLNPPEPTLDEIYDQQIQTNKLIKGIVLSLNDGSFVVGSAYTNAELKSIIKAKM